MLYQERSSTYFLCFLAPFLSSFLVFIGSPSTSLSIPLGPLQGPYRVHVFSSRSQDIEQNLITWTEWHKRMQWEPTYGADSQCKRYISQVYISIHISLRTSTFGYEIISFQYSIHRFSLDLMFFLTLFLFLYLSVWPQQLPSILALS